MKTAGSQPKKLNLKMSPGNQKPAELQRQTEESSARIDAEQDQIVETAFDMLVQANGDAKAAAATARRRALLTDPGAKSFWQNVAESIEDHGNLPGRS